MKDILELLIKAAEQIKHPKVFLALLIITLGVLGFKYMEIYPITNKQSDNVNEAGVTPLDGTEVTDVTQEDITLEKELIKWADASSHSDYDRTAEYTFIYRNTATEPAKCALIVSVNLKNNTNKTITL